MEGAYSQLAIPTLWYSLVAFLLTAFARETHLRSKHKFCHVGANGIEWKDRLAVGASHTAYWRPVRLSFGDKLSPSGIAWLRHFSVIATDLGQ